MTPVKQPPAAPRTNLLWKHLWFVMTLLAILAVPFLAGAGLVFVGVGVYQAIVRDTKGGTWAAAWELVGQSWLLWVVVLAGTTLGLWAHRQHAKCLAAEAPGSASSPLPSPPSGRP